MVESDNEREKVNDNKNMIQKSDNEIGKFWNRKKSTYRSTGPYYIIKLGNRLEISSSMLSSVTTLTFLCLDNFSIFFIQSHALSM